MKLIRRMVILAVFLMAMASVTAFAASGNASLKVNYRVDDKPVSNVELSLHRVGEWNINGGFAWTEPFGSYGLAFRHDDPAYLVDLAKSLEGYITRDSVEPMVTAVTGDDGAVTFDGLSQGVYLVTGKSYVSGDRTYYPTPMLAIVLEGEDSEIFMKHDSSKPPSDKDTTDRRVVKVWDDDGNGRPQEIKVQLLRDGKVYSEVVLNESNNWRHVWSGLNSAYNWTVVEASVPDGYSAQITRNGKIYQITNKKTVTGPDPGPGGNPGEKIPQTGMLQWPVTVLNLLGILFLIIGIVLHRKSGDRSL